MLTLYFAMKLFAIVGTSIVVGIVMTPLSTLLALLGWVTAMVGGVLLLTDPGPGILTLATGVGMIVLGIWMQRREVRIAAKEAEETSRRISRMMHVDLPTVDEDDASTWEPPPPPV
ncbi:MAG: hypothetical protein ACE5E5_03665 [Phycisphaerae bacterium]